MWRNPRAENGGDSSISRKIAPRAREEGSFHLAFARHLMRENVQFILNNGQFDARALPDARKADIIVAAEDEAGGSVPP